MSPHQRGPHKKIELFDGHYFSPGQWLGHPFSITFNFVYFQSAGWAGLKKLFKSLDICIFLFVSFVLGNCFGFVETFLFVYLKDELGAPMYLLGLTVTTGNSGFKFFQNFNILRDLKKLLYFVHFDQATVCQSKQKKVFTIIKLNCYVFNFLNMFTK